ncbi:Inositol polyphosphate 5-phosphatase [Thalictrum thalictroides]|uniref:Inositol polyphosphate 5-phosphatase n=1 Tax=Thalictrum thalictroides TaxID=46969 RepID=A0A7J6X9F4_THATH|nr:Inositol polyphosphate 5-phosphatase [Thalictrum thalictroides]
MNNNHDATHEGIKTIEVEEDYQFSSGSELHVCVVTWNMNGKVSSQDLAKLVNCDPKFDLLVIGLQEAPRCNIAQLLQEILVESKSLLGESIMQSLQLFVFGPKNYGLLRNEKIRVDKYAVGGLGGLIRRKKGAVAIRISIKGIRLVFISCHLAAHARNVEERNSQLKNISQSLFSKNQNPPYERLADVTVWLGDLNYRIKGQTVPVQNQIKKDLKLLTSKDQLLQEAERGQIFKGYCEGTLDFKPTYKYNVGSNNYDTSHKERVPSWTDRILFKIDKSDDTDATLHSYESLDHIRSSDHKPVRALLSIIP